jgi:hypothetical protein
MSTDTTPAARARFDALLRQRSGSDRVVMACEMFDLARELMAARVRELEPTIGDLDVKIRVFQRLYADDLDAETIARIVARMRTRQGSTFQAVPK